MSERLRVLFCDDSGGALRAFTKDVADPLGEEVEALTAASIDGYRQHAEDEGPFDVVISDLNFESVGGGPKDGLLILTDARGRWPAAELILVTAFSGSLAVEDGMDLGSAGIDRGNLFRKTSSEDPAQLWARLRERLTGIIQARMRSQEQLGTLEREGFYHRSRSLDETVARLHLQEVDSAALRIRQDPLTCYHDIVAQSFAMHELLGKVRRAAQRQSNVLVLGETGTGKELIARALHADSPRSDKPLVKTDLAALSHELIPAQLFGHEKGAYTGAQTARTGLVKEADGGVIFFDEIGNLSGEVQAGLLRVLEDRSFRPLGGERDLEVDVVVVAATHADLESEVAQGRFRADLLERLDVVRIALPPLRDRREDIPLLAVCFLDELRRRFEVSGFRRIEGEALELLARCPWARNVRQLRNSIERLFSDLDDDVDPIRAEHVRAVLPREGGASALQKSLSRQSLDGELGLSLAQIAKQFGEDAVREVIKDAFLELRGPPQDEQAAALFGGMKANTWRQFAWKRGLTYANVLAELRGAGD